VGVVNEYLLAKVVEAGIGAILLTVLITMIRDGTWGLWDLATRVLNIVDEALRFVEWVCGSHC